MLKKYKTIIPITILAIAFITALISSVPTWISIALMVLAAVLLIIASRGTFYFSKASKVISQRKPGYVENAIALYEKAFKLGVPHQYNLVIGTVFLQHGDIEKGREALEDVLNAKDKKLVFQAKEALSMYYWITKDLDKAIELCESAKEMNLKDRNLYINLGSYYLAKGRTKEFKSLIKEAFRTNMESVALIDLQAQYLIELKNFERAGNFLKALFDQATPSFVDPYLHYALVYMNYGEIDIAIKYLKDCLKIATFSNVSIFKSNDIEQMISYLENEETRWGFVKAALSDPISLFNGKMPSVEKNVAKPEFESLPTFVAEGISQKEVNEKEEEEPDTSLNEEDEIWLQKHQNQD